MTVNNNCIQRHKLRYFWLFSFLLLLTAGGAYASTPSETSSKTPSEAPLATTFKQSFNVDWLFIKGEQPGADKTKYDDKHWQRVNTPHDWAIEGPFDPRFNARNGGLPFHGTAWYRKHFKLDREHQGKVISIIFDGAMYNAHVYINGHFLGNRPFGYIGFQYDLSPHLNYGNKENVIAVTMAPEDSSARWYPGAGIYRDVWLDIRSPLHFKRNEIIVTTPVVSKEKAKISVVSTFLNTGKTATGRIVTRIIDANGSEVAKAEESWSELATNGAKTTAQTLVIHKPTLWDINQPYLYSIKSQLFRNNNVVDTEINPLGIRSIEFKADAGFFLNGRRVQIQGVCLHHDNGPLGAVANRRAIQRKLEIMQEMGANSIRTAHNPPSPLLVELADEMGILLQVEAFDVWKAPKWTIDNAYNKFFDEWHEQDLRDMIRQFRNNPSVIMWSIGNEIIEQTHKDGAVLAQKLMDISHSEDPSRLAAAGFNIYKPAIKNGLADAVDVAGFNYKPLNYQKLHQQHPEWKLLGSETSSITSTRGVYHFPLDKYQKHDSRHVTSYDIVGPPWAYPPDIEFEYLAKTPAVMGEYIWTGFDYLGEPTPYGGRDNTRSGYWNMDWPARSSSFGAVDLVGFPKDRFYLYQSQWTQEPMVHVLPHWNWENKIGDEIPVFAYTNAEEVELFINGKSMGKKIKGVDKASIPIAFENWDTLGSKQYTSAYRLRWDVKYQPGELKVVAYTGGKMVAEKVIKTAGPAARVNLVADRVKLNADGHDLSYISVLIEDAQGNLVPTADNKVRFFVEGAGEIAAVGNGDSATVEPFKADYRRAFSGKAMLIIKTIAGKTGDIRIRAYSDHLAGDQLILKSQNKNN